MPITLKAMMMGRDKTHAKELTPEIVKNAESTATRINALLTDLGWTDPAEVSSGWRPPSINGAVSGAAKKSLHMLGLACDLKDPKGKLAKALAARPDLLEKHKAWLEDPKSTKGWAHVDFGERPARKVRIFKP